MEPRKNPRPGRVVLQLLGLACLQAILGCSTTYYREAAEEEALAILKEKQKEAFGEERPFQLGPAGENPRAALLAEIEKARHGEGAPPAPLRLDLAKVLEVAALASREFQDQKEILFLSALSLSSARWEFDLHPSLTGSIGVDGNRRDADVSGRLQAGLSKAWSIGATTVATLLNTFSRTLTTGQPWSTGSVLSLGLTQPLLRGFGERITMEPLTQAERNVLYDIRDFERYRRRLVVQLATSYYRLLQQQDQIAIEEANLASLEQNLRRNEGLLDAGRIPKLQVDQNRQSVLTSQARLLNLRESLKSSLDSFKITLGLPVEAEVELAGSEFAALRERGLRSLELGESQAEEIALRHRLDLVTSRDEAEDAERRVAVAADALQMGLDLDLGLSVPSAERQPGKPVWRDTTLGAGLSFDLPLDRTRQRNSYRSSLVSLEQARRRLGLREDTIKQEVRERLRQIRQAEQDFEIQKQSVALALNRKEETETKLQAGRAIIRDVLEAQDALRSSQNALSRILVDHLAARLQLLRDMEVLQLDPEGLSYVDRIETARLLAPPPPDPAPAAAGG